MLSKIFPNGETHCYGVHGMRVEECSIDCCVLVPVFPKNVLFSVISSYSNFQFRQMRSRRWICVDARESLVLDGEMNWYFQALAFDWLDVFWYVMKCGLEMILIVCNVEWWCWLHLSMRVLTRFFHLMFLSKLILTEFLSRIDCFLSCKSESWYWLQHARCWFSRQ